MSKLINATYRAVITVPITVSYCGNMDNDDEYAKAEGIVRHEYGLGEEAEVELEFIERTEEEDDR